MQISFPLQAASVITTPWIAWPSHTCNTPAYPSATPSMYPFPISMLVAPAISAGRRVALRGRFHEHSVVHNGTLDCVMRCWHLLPALREGRNSSDGNFATVTRERNAGGQSRDGKDDLCPWVGGDTHERGCVPSKNKEQRSGQLIRRFDAGYPPTHKHQAASDATTIIITGPRVKVAAPVGVGVERET